jgi:stearoyl-CoA desaturase (delta-9 desaturase)
MAAAKRGDDVERYGHGTPDDWLERNLYTRFSWYGIGVMLVLDLLLFGIYGLTVWAVQMLWIPVLAAGVINGVGHYWGYRNFETPDASTNIVPWGILIGGEELHNNHHAFGSSAKFSIRPWELDVGWFYIRTLEVLGLAEVKKTAPVLALAPDKSGCDLDTVRTIVTSRFHIMASFAREVIKSVWREELKRVDPEDRERWRLIKRARRLLVRETALLDEPSRHRLSRVLELNARLRTVYQMKESLQNVWRRSATTQEHLLRALEEWCRQAEASGIQALREFSRKLPAYQLAPARS